MGTRIKVGIPTYLARPKLVPKSIAPPLSTQADKIYRQWRANYNPVRLAYGQAEMAIKAAIEDGVRRAIKKEIPARQELKPLEDLIIHLHRTGQITNVVKALIDGGFVHSTVIGSKVVPAREVSLYTGGPSPAPVLQPIVAEPAPAPSALPVAPSAPTDPLTEEELLSDLLADLEGYVPPQPPRALSPHSARTAKKERQAAARISAASEVEPGVYQVRMREKGQVALPPGAEMRLARPGEQPGERGRRAVRAETAARISQTAAQLESASAPRPMEARIPARPPIPAPPGYKSLSLEE